MSDCTPELTKEMRVRKNANRIHGSRTKKGVFAMPPPAGRWLHLRVAA